MKLKAACLTNVGMKRAHNEDSVKLVPEENLFVVADGMGGHACGEVASNLAVECVAQFFRETSADDERTWPFKEERGLKYEENRLVTGIKLANRTIYEHAQADVKKRGMGTTVVGALFTHGAAYVGHCGDSRAYRFRSGQIEQLTEDHSLLNDYLKAHTLTPEEIENFPHKNVIVRALGMKESVNVDVQRIALEPFDIYMFCSDGLSGMVTDPEMNDIINGFLSKPDHSDDVEGMCQALIDAANAAGGTDNVTAICVKVLS